MLESKLEDLLREWIVGQGYQLVERADWPVTYTTYYKNLPLGDEIGVCGRIGYTFVLFTVRNNAWKTAFGVKEVDCYRVRMIQGGVTHLIFLSVEDGVFTLTR